MPPWNNFDWAINSPCIQFSEKSKWHKEWCRKEAESSLKDWRDELTSLAIMRLFFVFLSAITSSAGAPVLNSCSSLNLSNGFLESVCLKPHLIFFLKVITDRVCDGKMRCDLHVSGSQRVQGERWEAEGTFACQCYHEQATIGHH